MAIKLSAAYSKKAGLPGYSSHSFSVSIETELQNLDNVRQESARLYDSLQEAVDQQIQKQALFRLMATAWKRTRTVFGTVRKNSGN